MNFRRASPWFALAAIFLVLSIPTPDIVFVGTLIASIPFIMMIIRP